MCQGIGRPCCLGRAGATHYVLGTLPRSYGCDIPLLELTNPPIIHVEIVRVHSVHHNSEQYDAASVLWVAGGVKSVETEGFREI